MDTGRNCGLRKGVDHFERKFQGEEGSSTNDCWCQEARVPGLSRDVGCVIILLAVLIQYQPGTDTHTHTQTDRDIQTHDGYYPRIASAAQVKWVT